MLKWIQYLNNFYYFHNVADAYQIKNQKGLHFLTLQVVGWAAIFTRQSYRDIIIDSFVYCR